MPRAYKRSEDKNRKNKGKNCVGPGCTRDAIAKGLCDTHYQQLRRYGKMNPIGPVNTRVDDIPGIGYETDAE